MSSKAWRLIITGLCGMLLVGCTSVVRRSSTANQEELNAEKQLLSQQQEVIIQQLQLKIVQERAEILSKIEQSSMGRDPNDIKLTTGDQITVEVWLHDQIQQQVGYPLQITIPQDGVVFMPSIGNVTLLEHSPREIQRVIEQKIADIIVNPTVKVIIGKHRGYKVSILGEVARTSTRDSGPGAYDIESETPLSAFVSKVGGYTPNADIRNIRVTTLKGTSMIVDLQRIVDGHTEEDCLLKGGETVYIPELARNNYVILVGHIGKPGTYPLSVGMRLSQLIANAGGVLKTGSDKRVLVVRGDRYHPQLIKLDLHSFYTDGDWEEDIELQTKDIVYVPRSYVATFEEYIRILLLPLTTVSEVYFIKNQLQTN